MELKPRYDDRPIRSIESLSLALGVAPELLTKLADSAEARWRAAKPLMDGPVVKRQPWDAHPPLKDLHSRIKKRILERVSYPLYMTGSLRGQSPRTNAKIHVGAALVVKEDISRFFPSTKREAIYRVWANFFDFSPEVAEILTQLTTRCGALPEGGICSSYLANLVFWREESKLIERLEVLGFRYSRYVDDVCISTRHDPGNETLASAVSLLMNLLSSQGYRIKRSKHELQRGHLPMTATGHSFNRKVGLPRTERSAIRATVHQVCERIVAGERGPAVTTALNAATSHAGRLGALYPADAAPLKSALRKVRNLLAAETKPPMPGAARALVPGLELQPVDDGAPPW